MKTILLLAAIIFFSGCAKQPEPKELQYTTVMECINDAKLNDRDMKLIGNNARDMSVEDFIKWYNDNYAQ